MTQKENFFINIAQGLDGLHALLNAAFYCELPVSIWRLPNSREVNLITDFSFDNDPKKIIIHQENPGFVISPFNNLDNSKNYYIKSDLHFSTEHGITIDPSLSGENKVFNNFIASLRTKNTYTPRLSAVFQDDATNQNHFKALVSRCIDKIKSSGILKIVPSRHLDVDIPSGFDALEIFLTLNHKYARSFNYLFYIPNVGMWIGATPELLLEEDPNGIFKTVALAGTKILPGEEANLSSIPWTQKEIEEQAIVSRFIINCFKKIRLREFEEYGPKTIRAGHLAHLKTIFQVNLNAVNFPELSTTMLELLHPTSAICGMPRREAYEFLSRNEDYSREFYSGFLGPVNINNHTHIFVNLRCLQVMKNKLRFYAGAGVTEDSDPQSEFDETEQKMHTLRGLIE